MTDDLGKMLDALEPVDILDYEGCDHRQSHGGSGEQLNLKECPHCGNSDWKVYLNEETGLGNCFVCEETFNKFSFLWRSMGSPAKRETVDRIKELSRSMGWRPARKRVHVEVTGDLEVKLPYHIALPTEKGMNLPYLLERDVSNDLTAYFSLLFCEYGEYLVDKGLGESYTQNFRQRVLIPVFDLDGTLVTFQGRDITGTAEKKYLFPAGLPGTSEFLFNGQNAIGAKRVCLGEGGFDAIAIKRALDENITLRDVVPIASFGKHLSMRSKDGNDQLNRFLQLKKMGLREVTIMWDGEIKAFFAAIDAAKIMHGIGLIVKIAQLPAGADPDEVSSEIVRQCFKDADKYSPMWALKMRAKPPYKK